MTDRVSYLTAKRQLDDRSIDRGLLARLRRELPTAPSILEVGAGTATMVERLYEWDVLTAGEWIALDADPSALAAGRERLLARDDTTSTPSGLRLGGIDVRFLTADAADVSTAIDRSFDLVVGCAFFDVVDLGPVLAGLAPCCDLVYAPITYAGETSFAPADPADDVVLGWYRHHMRTHRPGTADGAGGLAEALGQVLAEAPSDWAIEPPYDPADARLVDHLLDTIDSAVAETGHDASDWVARRRRQLALGQLSYRARNRDILGRIHGSATVDSRPADTIR